MSNGKVMIIHLIASLIRTTQLNEVPLYKNESIFS